MKLFILNILVKVIEFFNNMKYFTQNRNLGNERAKDEVYSKGDSVSYLYHNTYKLGSEYNLPHWEETDPAILDEENVLMAFYYSKSGNIAGEIDGNEWYGWNRFTFYIIENNDKLYIKYFNLRKLGAEAERIALEKFSNIPFAWKESYGRRTTEYKKKLLEEVCKIVYIDRNEFNEKVNAIKNIDFSESFLNFFGYNKALERLNYYDYINKNIFYTDDYCLISYKPCIELFNYILEKCNILHMTKTDIKFFEEKDRETVMKKLVDIAIERSELLE